MMMRSINELRSLSIRSAFIGMIAWLSIAGAGHAQSQFLIVDHDARIVRFESAGGEVIDHFVAKGISTLTYPQNAVYGPDGNLYVANNGGHSIPRYDGQTGKPLGELIAGPSGINSPTDLKVGPDGFLYVCSHGDNTVQRIDFTTGGMTTFIASGNNLKDAHGLAFDAAGRWYVASYFNDRVLRYDAAGNYLDDAIPQGVSPLSGPIGGLVDAEQRLFVSSRKNNTVIRKDLTTGTIVKLFTEGTAGLQGPHYLNLASNGDLLVVGLDGDGQFLRFNRASGEFLGPFLTPFSGGLSGDPIAVLLVPDVAICYPDCDGDGVLSIDDFLCFQTFFALGC